MIPASAAGRGGNDDKRIKPGLKIDHDEQIDKDDGEAKAGQQADIGRPASSRAVREP